MRITKYLLSITFLMAPVRISFSQEIAFEVKPYDTSIYDEISCAVYQSTDQIGSSDVNWRSPSWPGGQLLSVLYNQTTSKYDVFINQVKTASISKPSISGVFSVYSVSQTVFNSDKSWEMLILLPDTSYRYKAILTDESGAAIWTTSPTEFYKYCWFDGTYTYLSVDVEDNPIVSQRFYRFHPATSAVSSSLSKTTSLNALSKPIITFGGTGECKIKLSRSPAGATTVCLFNLLGQQLFSQTVPDLKKDITFTIPANSIAGGPVITQVQNNHGVSLTKSIPVR